jgi:hypothetical protein
VLIGLLLFVTLAQATPSIKPTKPESPTDSSDLLLRTVVADMVRKGYWELREGPLIIERNHRSISPRILPDDWKPGFALLAGSEIRAAEMRGRYYMTLRTEWRSSNEA